MSVVYLSSTAIPHLFLLHHVLPADDPSLLVHDVLPALDHPQAQLALPLNLLEANSTDHLTFVNQVLTNHFR